MRWWDKIGVRELLATHSGLRISTLTNELITLEGQVAIHAQLPGANVIDEEFSIRIEIPASFPKKLPKVFETAEDFVRDPDYHTYQDGSLCLGSDIRLLQVCAENQNIFVFFEKVVVPCLYSISHKLKYGTSPYGELGHGEVGLIDDYEKLFGLDGKQAVLLAIKALSKRYREANKLKCPCGCALRLGRCDFRLGLNKFRYLAKRSWFDNYLKSYFQPIQKKQNSRKTKKLRPPERRALNS